MKARNESTAGQPAITGSFENAADRAVLDQIAAAQAAGQDPFGDGDGDGDNDNDDGAGGAEPIGEGSGTTSEGGNQNGGAEEGGDGVDELKDGGGGEAGPPATAAPAVQGEAPAAPAPQPPAQPVQAVQPLQFRTRSLNDLEAAQTTVATKRAEAWKAYSEGTMTPEEYAAIDTSTLAELMNISSERTLLQASIQSAQNAAQSALDAVKIDAKKPENGGIDYDADPTAASEFDAAVDLLVKSPKWAKQPDSAIYAHAHKTVLFARGITPTQTANESGNGGKPKAREDLTGPITLRTLPSASNANANGGINDQLSRLKGQDFQEAIGNMPRAQRDAYLDS